MTRTREHTQPGWGWQEQAACRGRDLSLFFAPDSERPPARARREAEARKICARCPVRAECLSHALAVPEAYGVWGGMSEEERAAERRRRRRSAA
jgi:WhiB family transcriptional regulator, redox-sensing transcriptional regulator